MNTHGERLRKLAALTCFLLLANGPDAQGQMPRADFKAKSCVAADSALGVQTKAEKSGQLVHLHLKGRDETMVRGPFPRGPSGIAVMATWSGKFAAAEVLAQLEVMVPTALLKQPLEPGDIMTLVVNDSLKLPLGVPAVPSLLGSGPGSAVSINATLQQEHLLALARAKSVALEFRGLKFRATSAEVTTFDAMYRVITCGVDP